MTEFGYMTLPGLRVDLEEVLSLPGALLGSSARGGIACSPIRRAHAFGPTGGALPAALRADAGKSCSRMVDSRRILPWIPGVTDLSYHPESKLEATPKVAD